MSFIVGLTGGIGSGKTAAAERFAQLGAAIVDTDLIAHELTAPKGAAIERIRAAFGDEVITIEGALDRAAMRRKVFNDPAAKARLEGILHPMIRAESERQTCAAFENGAPYVVLVVPLLIESGNFRQRVQRVAVVDVAEDMQVARVAARSGLSEPEVRAIMATQIDRVRRNAAADDLVDNSGDLASLYSQVDALHGKYLEIAAHS